MTNIAIQKHPEEGKHSTSKKSRGEDPSRILGNDASWRTIVKELETRKTMSVMNSMPNEIFQNIHN